MESSVVLCFMFYDNMLNKIKFKFKIQIHGTRLTSQAGITTTLTSSFPAIAMNDMFSDAITYTVLAWLCLYKRHC